jgi:hypothetical protein
VGSLAADLLGVDARGLVAVVAVGDQQLGVGERALERGDAAGVGDPPERVDRAVVVGRGRERRLGDGLGQRRGGVARGVGEEAEDRGEVGPRRPRQPQPVLLRAGMGALVRPDPPGAVLLDPHPREEAAPPLLAAVRRRVLLVERPERRLALLDQRPLGPPVVEQGLRVEVLVPAVLGRRQVDLDHVVRRLRHKLRPQLLVDHVIRRRDHSLQRPHDRLLVPKRPQRLYLGHGG